MCAISLFFSSKNKANLMHQLIKRRAAMFMVDQMKPREKLVQFGWPRSWLKRIILFLTTPMPPIKYE